MSPKPFVEMTEEEKVEWAKTYTWQSRTKVTPGADATSGKKKIQQRVTQRIKDQQLYYDPVKREKKFGEKYNARLRYLYQHNEAFRELKKYRVAFRDFQRRRDAYEAWTVKYYAKYKDKMVDHASTFKLEGTENFVHGFTMSDLVTFSPAKKALMSSLLADNIFPAPKYRGFKWNERTKKFNDTVDEFYLVSEVEAYLNVFARYRKKFTMVKTEEQKLFLKKNFWKTMINARDKFDNE